ncbi:AAA family ATPase [Kutzneria sp. CA-103260]|uniref:AAA family ATPase n=1 Tax=Kutzneria sp. CA-103260 TaxID=2802641 RepID=UPI001BAA9E82|nr:AAA family ATPase [Kutzneria sp. CA-103260]QUQ67346.1 Cytidylate kinase [Kutzneria sp. CA-103260]
MLVVAVCGSPGAGKTTVARATARHLGVPLLSRDELKTGLGLSATAEGIRFPPDFHIAGGPFSVRAEAVMVDTARLLASAGMTFVVESSVLSPSLLDAVRPARVLAVHVTADASVIGHRLRARTGITAQQLAAQFQRGEMPPSIFVPPSDVDAVVTVDTSDHQTPDVEPIEAAALALFRDQETAGTDPAGPP